MKTLTVAIIGHRSIKDKKELMAKLKKELCRLIEEDNAETFLFGSKSVFDDISWIVVTELKEKFYPLIKRVYIRAMNEKIDENYRAYLLNSYEDTFYPYGVKKAGYYAYVTRNRIMIDMCDVVLTYYDKNYNLPQGKSGTRVAIEYAIKKKKRVVNIFDTELK